MAVMLRARVLAALVFVMPSAAAAQELGVLRIRVALPDAVGMATPVPRHALLISENPASAPPRRTVTGLDGTAEVRLRPGNYTVESDRPVAFHGNTYQWTQTVDIVSGRDTALELTADNAEVEPVASATAASEASETDPSFLVHQWRDSVVAIWTPTARASGFVIDASGLVATNQRVIGNATSVEVQITPAIKVAASVIEADPVRDVAVLWIDPKVITSLRPVPMSCAQAEKPAAVGGQEIFTIGVPLRQPKDMTSGKVTGVDPGGLTSDVMLASGSAGGPVFTARGELIGITSVAGGSDPDRLEDVSIVRVEEACAVVATAEKKMKAAGPPAGTHLPVEPVQPFPAQALDAAAERGGRLKPYTLTASDFEVAFITPVLTYVTQHQWRHGRPRTTSEETRSPEADLSPGLQLMDFSNWSEYVMDYPPVLLVRVTPRLVEGFWTKVARGAARTGGVSIPPIKRFRSGFARLRAFCGDAEVTPIHPFKLERRVSETDAIYEGLYVFDPGALGPHCATVRLVLFSEKEPEKGDTRIVDPKVVQQIWDDFAPHRALGR